MMHDVRPWDEMEETGLRLCAENTTSPSLPTEVTACCWDPNSPGVLGLCGADGSLVLVRHGSENETTLTATGSYAVFFNTLPVHLWGRRGEGGNRTSPPPPSAPARRVEQAWSQVSFVPGHPREVVFVQGWSNRVLLASLPQGEARSVASVASVASLRYAHTEGKAEGRFGLVDGSRVVALDGHRAQVQCLAVDGRGVLLLTGDEAGMICARLLHGRHGDGGHRGTAYQSQSLGEEGAPEGDVVAKIVGGAHEGGVLALSHVEGSLREEADGSGESSTLFVSGGVGGVVRLWRSTVLVRKERAGVANTELQVEALTDMLVGSFQVSCLASSLAFRVPLVLAGTTEGTVFAFLLREPPREGEHLQGGGGGDHGSGRGNGRQGFTASDVVAVGSKLGLVLMKFEHTTRPIESVCCSQEQELIAATDAEGIVRTYRPVHPSGYPGTIGTVEEEQPSPRGEVPGGSVGGALARPFELIVECRLGSRPISCEFASQGARREGGQGWQGRGPEDEVLRTCTRDGSLRVWPTASLPTHPIRQPAPEDEPLSAPPSLTFNNDGDGKGDVGAGAAAGNGQEKQEDVVDPFARWAGTRAEREALAGEKEGAEEEPTARGEVPVPGARPAAPRRVSFAPADKIYELQEPYYSTGRIDRWAQEHEEDDEDSEVEAPRPPPPAPTPAPTSSTRPRRLRQTWGSPAPGRGHGSTGPEREDASHSGSFVTPSKLQEASMWSTAVEQAALERRMREEFDASAVQEPREPAYRAAAANVVNIHPLATTFEGLVPVSLDVPPPRPRRKGKQVSKVHLSRVQEQRITEEDLVFHDMEPACSSVAELGRSGMWPHAELEWYGRPAACADLEDSSVISDRVWSMGRRP